MPLTTEDQSRPCSLPFDVAHTPLQFQLRFSPSLANKPKAAPSASSEPRSKPFNPFENPPSALTITPLGPSHLLVLNKFAIVPEHFILITRAFKPQTHLLDAEDLAAVYACIRAYHEHGTEGAGRLGGEEELFAFFNSGPHSGASQPHRHVQLLPVARMRDGLDAAGAGEAGRWSVLADRLVAGGEDADEGRAAARLPFAAFAERLRPEMSASDLRAAYLRLYRRACGAAGDGQPGERRGEEEEEENDQDGGAEARISYNLAVTRGAMVLCPRAAEGDAVRDGEGREVGRLALNGTVLAGTALVKSREEWDALRRDGAQLWEILGRIGVPPERR